MLSLCYLIMDITILLSLLASAIWLEAYIHGWLKYLLLLIVYPFLAGIPMTGLWVIGHECGHGAFSSSNAVNNVIGLLIHSSMFAPYFAWRSSHARHHQFANNMSTDLNYVPPMRTEYKNSIPGKFDLHEVAEDAPFLVFCRILLQQLCGWPWYLLTQITAGPNSSPRRSRGWWDNSHFLPSSSLFRPSEYWTIILSDLGLICTGLLLSSLAHRFGVWTIFWAYILPWIWVNHWIGMDSQHPTLSTICGHQANIIC